MFNIKVNTKWGKCMILACSLLVFAGVTGAPAAEQITGDWEFKMDLKEHQITAKVNFVKNADGTFSGTWVPDMPRRGGGEFSDTEIPQIPEIKFELESITFDNNELTFLQKASVDNVEHELYYFGTLKDGKIEGYFESDFGDTPAIATRVKPAVSPVGDWNVKVRYNDSVFDEKLRISKNKDGKLTGKWISQLPEDEITDLKFENSKLNFVRRSKMNNGDTEFKFEGIIVGNNLIGKFASGVNRIDVTGFRKIIPLPGDWEIITASERGKRTSLLTINEDMTATYRLGDNDVPVRDLKYEYGQLAFVVDLSFGEIVFRMDFTGQVSGTTIEGEFTTPRGVRKVTGKKIFDVKNQCEQQCALPLANNPGPNVPMN